MTRHRGAAKASGSRRLGGHELAAPGRRLARLLPGGIRARLFLLIVLAAVPVLILQGWIYYQRHNMRREQALQTEVEVAQGIAMTFSAYLDGLHRQLDIIGQAILGFFPYSDVELERVLKEATAEYPSLRTLSWVSPEGKILVSNLAEGVGRDLSVRPYFQKIQAGAPWAIGDMTPQGAILDIPTVAMGAAVRDDDGRLLGVVVASLEPTRLGELTFPHQRRAGGVYTIIDSQGHLVYRSPAVSLTWEDRVRWRHADPLVQGALKGQTTKGVIISPVAKKRVIAARVPIAGAGWVAGAARPVDIAIGPVRRALFQDALLGLLVASLALLLASLLAHTIAEPLRRLEHDAQAMGAGVIETSEGLQAPTEVSRLRDSVSAMAAGLIDRAEALRQSEERYRTLFTNMSEGFALGEAVFREDGAACNFRLLEINDAYEQQTGLTREILGKPITEVLPNLERRWIDAYCGVARTGESVRFTEYNKDTGRHYDVFCYSPAKNRFAVLFRDVTERVQYEQALRTMNEQLQQQTEELQVQAEELQSQAEELRATNEALEGREREYRTLAENAPEVIARFDRGLRHTYINEYGARVYGVPQRAVLGKTNADLGMPAEKVAFWKDRFEQVLATGKQQTVEFEFDSPTFGRQYFSSLFVPEFNARGEIASILAITRDVTETRRAQEAVRSAALFPEENPSPVLRVTRDGTLLYANACSVLLLESWNCRVGGTVPDDIRGQIARALDAVQAIEAEVACGDVLYSFSLAPVVSEDYVNLYGRDITARKRAEKALEERNRFLNSVLESLTHPFYVVDAADYSIVIANSATGLKDRSSTSRCYLATHNRSAPCPDTDADHPCPLEEVKRTGKPTVVEHIHYDAEGNPRNVEVHAYPLFDAQGHVAQMIEYCLDITERKQAEEALRESEGRHRRLIENLKGSHFIYVHDTQGVFRYLSESITDVLGYTPDEFMTDYDKYLTEHPANQAVRRHTELSIQGIRQPAYEINIRHKDGSTRWLEVQEVPVFDEGGKVAAVEGVAQDITERKRAEEALRESEQWFRTLTNAMPQLVWTADPDGRVDYYNDRYREYRGIEQTAEGSFQWAPVLHEDDVAPTVEAWERAIRTGESYQIEHRVQRADGSYHWHLSRSTPVRDTEGRIAKWFGTATDIDDLKRAEEAVRQSESFYRQTLESIPGMVFTTRPDGYCDYQSQQWVDYTGVPMAEHLGDGWNKLLHPEDQPRASAVWRAAVEGRSTYDLEYRVRRRDGRYEWFKAIGRPIRDEAGQIVRWFGVAINIEAIKQAEEGLRRLAETLEIKVAQRTAELEHRARQLQKLTLELSQTEDRERRRLADILHDDLQQQLAAVKFHLGLLSNRTRHDAVLQRTTTQLDRMLADAVETSRNLSHELSPATLYQGNLGETFEWLANQIRTKHGLDVRVHSDGEVNLESDALKAFLFKAAQEMLFNVVKHARVGAADIRVRRCGPHVCLVVSDHGRGFDPQDLKATAGFGLFSIRERVQLLGGRMKIKSVKGKGSTFFIAVPDNQKMEDGEQKAEGEPGLSSVVRRPSSVFRVLVADDHEVVRQGLAAILRDEPDIEVVGEAANGREAVDMANRLHPDVVIMDVAMPLMNGDEATRQTKLHLPGIRVIALSMYAEDGMVERMRRAGAECYILKTAPAGELLATIRGKKACA